MAGDPELNNDTNRVPSQQQLDDLLANGIKANADPIANVIVRDEIAVVVYQLAPGDSEGNQEALALGWDGQSPVFELGISVKQRLIQNLLPCVDLAFVSGEGVVSHSATLQTNVYDLASIDPDRPNQRVARAQHARRAVVIAALPCF